MASKVHELLLHFDQTFPDMHFMQQIVGINVELHAYVDSKTIFDIIANDSQTNKQCLQIDINALQET